MSDNKPAPDPNKKPRRALTSEERLELFREFKLALIALAVLVVLVVTLCWDRGGNAARAAARDQELQKANLHLVWQTPKPPDFDHRIGTEGAKGGPPPVPPNHIGQQQPVIPVIPVIKPLPPPVVPPAPPQPRFRDYTVQRGDSSLWKIASRTMGNGSRWPLIKEANPGLDPVLRIPLPNVRPPAATPMTSAMVSMITPAPAVPTVPTVHVAALPPKAPATMPSLALSTAPSSGSDHH
jgi:hypothetical protein